MKFHFIAISFFHRIHICSLVRQHFSWSDFFKNFFQGWKHGLTEWNEFLAEDIQNSRDAPQECFVQVKILNSDFCSLIAFVLYFALYMHINRVSG